MARPTPPSLGAESFSCPHCGALAHQYWFKIIPDGYGNGKRPVVMTVVEAAKITLPVLSDRNDKKATSAFKDRFAKNDVTYLVNEYRSQSLWELVNMNLSMCHSCKAFTIWVKESIVYPAHDVAILPHEDMPKDVRFDFVEAAEVVNKSPRGAAALLRLAIQKLMPHLEEDATNLNNAIGNLVKKGLDQRVQRALDVVRVTGNNAVHPGELDLKDNTATAMQLFALVNVIVQSTIGTKNQIDTIYGLLPPGALEAIEKRDA